MSNGSSLVSPRTRRGGSEAMLTVVEVAVGPRRYRVKRQALGNLRKHAVFIEPQVTRGDLLGGLLHEYEAAV